MSTADDSINELEKDAVAILSSNFDSKKPTVVPNIKKRKGNLKKKIPFGGIPENKERRWGKLIISNPVDFHKDPLFLKTRNVWNVDDPHLFRWKPHDLFLIENVNFKTWIMIHFPVPSKILNEIGTPSRFSHLNEDENTITSTYLEYRKLLSIPGKQLYFCADQEEYIFKNSFAVYTKNDELFLNHVFPTLTPFPKCENWIRMSFLKFLELVVLPIYIHLISKHQLIDHVKRKLRSKEDVYLLSESLPSLKSIKWDYLFLGAKLFSGKFLISKLKLIQALVPISFNLEKIFFLLLNVAIFDVDKKWLKF